MIYYICIHTQTHRHTTKSPEACLPFIPRETQKFPSLNQKANPHQIPTLLAA